MFRTRHYHAAVMLLAVLWPLTALADTIHVALCGDDAWTGASAACAAPDGPKATIQAAIDAAAHGDEIVVAAGTYNEAIDFNGKAVHLRSSGGPGATTIDATGIGGSVVACVSGEGPDTILEGFTITGGTGSRICFPFGCFVLGGGMVNLDTSPTVIDCIFTGNRAEFGGGMINQGSPRIVNCTFIDNHAEVNSGGMGNGVGMGVTVTVIGCVFRGNTAGSHSGALGIGSDPDDTLIVINCLFEGNMAGQAGGAINTTASRLEVTNCVFSGNRAPSGGAIDVAAPGSASVANSILWGNAPEEIGETVFGLTTVSYSDVMGGWPGVGNIDADPLFVDPASGDFRLSAGSPCIDAGDSTAVPAGVTTDLAGLPRFVGGGVDMGAYEFQGCYADCDASGELDFFDFLCFQNLFAAQDPAADCDGSGELDFFDFLCFQNAFAAGCP